MILSSHERLHTLRKGFIGLFRISAHVTRESGRRKRFIRTSGLPVGDNGSGPGAGRFAMK